MSPAREIIEKAFSELGLEFRVDSTNDRAVAYSLAIIDRLAENAPGKWTFQEKAVGDRRHPVRHILADLRRLDAHVNECKHSAQPNQSRDFSASELFLDGVYERAGGYDVSLVIAMLKNAAEDAIRTGIEREQNRPPNTVFAAFVREIEILYKITAGPRDDGETFVFLAFACQKILPKEMQVKDRSEILRARERNREEDDRRSA